MANFKKQSGLVLADSLRKAVLQWAIQGQLVAQKADDGQASDLLKAIKTEKARLVADKVIKKEKPLAEITDDEKPFDIPDNWVWVKLGDVMQINPRNRDEDEIDSAFMPMNLLNDGYSNSFTFETRKWGSIKKGFTHFAENDIVFAKITPCFQNRKSAIINNVPNKIGAGTTELHVLRIFKKTINLKYVLYFVKNPIFINDGVATFTGTAGQQRIGTDFVKNYLFPLPPLAEQERIVATLDEILPQIDDLAKSETVLNALQSAFPKQMQSALLLSAISGKLTEQLESDGNASDLLTQIQAEKQRLIKEKIIKKEKPLADITDEEIPFDIPDNWVWVRLGQIVSYNMGKTPPRTSAEYWQDDYPWVSIADMVESGNIITTKEKVSQTAYKDIFKEKISKTGTMIMSFKLTIGRVSILDIDAFHNEAIISIYPNLDEDNAEILKSYLFKILPYISNWGNSKKAIKGNTLNSDSINNMLTPLPPLAEQKRIIAKLDELLPQVQALVI